MGGVNSHTHDYIAIGGYSKEEKLINCELCNNPFWESSLHPYKDYQACEECIRLSEEQDKENEA